MDVLPDELLVSIISLLSAKERAKSSILARRWRYFWKSTRIISFHDSDIHICRRTNKAVFVNRLLKSHSGESVDELRIESACLNINNADDIDGWIRFAFNKKVQKLHLNFNADADTDDGGWKWKFFQFKTPDYSFPNVERFGIGPWALVSLYLNQVDLRRERVESLMCNCPNLEGLHIETANGLNSFGCPAASATRLRRLALINCKNLTTIEMRAPNLVSYEIVVHECRTDLTYLIDHRTSMPSLTHLSLGTSYTCVLLNHLHHFSGLDTLNLQTNLTEFEMEMLLELGIPSLPRLRKLVVETGREGAGMILCFTHLKAAPLLRQIHLKFTTAFPTKPKLPAMGFRQKHECLKELQVDGYTRDVDREMIQYLMENTVSLEKVVLNNLPYTGQHLHLLKTNLQQNS